MRRSSVLRRRDKFSESLDNLSRAREKFQQLPAPIDVAKVDYQFGYVALVKLNDYKAAEEKFQNARATFLSYKMPLWTALCDHALGQVYMESGRIKAAVHSFEEARNALTAFKISGALGDALFDSAKTARMIGDHAISVKQLHQAKRLYNQVGVHQMEASVEMHLGSTYREWGFYQLALHYLEQAQQKFLEMDHPGRLAECHMRLAHVWLQINRLDEANGCLEQAIYYYE
jgi:predicted negative regulator of RcsB-dependent stress response